MHQTKTYTHRVVSQDGRCIAETTTTVSVSGHATTQRSVTIHSSTDGTTVYASSSASATSSSQSH